MIDQLVEKTKENQTFRGDYMAWGLAEQDAEKRGYNAGAEQAKIDTAKKLLLENLPIDLIVRTTGLPLETIQKLAETQEK